MYTNEIQVAKKAEQILESALKSKVSSFGEHLNRKDGEASIQNIKVKSVVKKYGTKKAGNQQAYLRRIAIRMGRHGFIQHFGVDTIRNGGTRTRQKPKETQYNFKSHFFKMEAKPFINQAIEESGVIDFVMEEITKIRSEEVIFEVKKILENKY